MRECLESAHISRNDLAAVGITNQRETLVIWNRLTGKPLYNAIVWMDCRGDEVISHFRDAHEKEWYQEKTGLPLSSYFTAPKLYWAIKNVPGVREGLADGSVFVGTIDSWLLWNLTGGVDSGLHFTDVTNASRTMLMNIHSGRWDKELLDVVGVPASALPEIRSCSEVYGRGVGVLEGVRFSGSLGDQQAALFGQTCFGAGEMKNTYGTGCFILMNTGERAVRSHNGLVTTVAYKLGEGPLTYALEGSVTIAGALVQWLRDNLGLIHSSAEVGVRGTVPRRSRRSPPAWRLARACTWCPRFRDCTRPTGVRTRAAASWG